MSDTIDKLILREYGIADAVLLGHGMEARVYAINDSRVLRIYKPRDAIDGTALRQLQEFYASLSQTGASFQTPRMHSIKEVAGHFTVVDQRLYGVSLDEALARLDGSKRRQALVAFVEAAEQICNLHPPFTSFGEILGSRPIRAASWPEFIMKRLAVDYANAKSMFDAALPHMQKILDFIAKEVELVSDCTAQLVHGDFYTSNVLVNDQQQITAVLDFNDLTLAGDPRMDLASALIYFFEGDGNSQQGDASFLYSRMIAQYGQDMARIIHLYRLYYAVHFASWCETSDPKTFEWAMRTFRQHLAGKYDY